MKSKKIIWQRICFLSLAVCLAFGLTGNVLAGSDEASSHAQTAARTTPSPEYQNSEKERNSIEPYYNRILKLTGSIDIDAARDLGYFTACVTAQEGKATSTHVKAVIQRKTGSYWTDYLTYYQTGGSWRAYWLGNNIPLDNGYTYRLKVVGTVYYNNMSESDTLYTAEQRA